MLFWQHLDQLEPPSNRVTTQSGSTYVPEQRGSIPIAPEFLVPTTEHPRAPAAPTDTRGVERRLEGACCRAHCIGAGG